MTTEACALLPICNQQNMNPTSATLELRIFDKKILKATCRYLVEKNADQQHAVFFSPQVLCEGYLEKIVAHLKQKYTSVKMIYVETDEQTQIAVSLKKANLITDALDNEYSSIF